MDLKTVTSDRIEQVGRECWKTRNPDATCWSWMAELTNEIDREAARRGETGIATWRAVLELWRAPKRMRRNATGRKYFDKLIADIAKAVVEIANETATC